MPFVNTQTTAGLGVTTVNIPTSDVYNFIGTLTTTSPNAGSATQGAGGGAGTGTGAPPPIASQVVVTVRQNGSIIFTSNSGARGFALNTVVCTAADVMTFTTSSSLDQDKQPGAIKMTLATSQGPL